MTYRLLFNQVTPYIPILLKGLIYSVFISGIGMFIGTILGILCALARLSNKKIINMIANIYVEVFRNTPLLIQMYLLYFGFAQFEIHVSAISSAIIALILNNGAYTGVIFETGLKAVDKGQKEAAAALGMSIIESYRYITIPQAFRIVIPPLTNQFISLFLFSSVASTVSVPELLSQTLNVDSLTMRTFEVFILATILYLLITTAVSIFSSRLESKFKY